MHCRDEGALPQHSTDDMEEVITTLIIASMTQRYQAVGVVPIITYNICSPHTNCFESNQIFTFPSNAHSTVFLKHSLWTLFLSLDEGRAQRGKNRHVVVYGWINFALCTCLSRMHLGPPLVFCVSAPDWAWQLCTISCYRTQLHRQREEKQRTRLQLNSPAVRANLSTVILLMSWEVLIS